MSEGRALVFIGFMGAGKSSAARAAAGRGLEAVDADEVVERELGMPIADFFASHGEEEFRRRESEIVGGLLERATGDAIALGGGSLESERVRVALRRHVAVWLDVEPRGAWQRASSSGTRPLALDRDRFMALHDRRRPLYEEAADGYLPAGDRGLVHRALPAVTTLLRAPAQTKLVWATSRSGEYPVFVGPGVLDAGVWPTEPAGRRICVTDANVGPLHGGRVPAVDATVTLPAGEQHKTLATAEHVWRELARAGMAREDELVALGGGVVGDLAGFCAATYQRGVPVVQVPTTLVAQVDSAYGGKTGVDLPEAKNYVGAYHQPAGVLADTSLLASLPPAELAAGHAEVLKTALIAGGELWERVAGGEEVDATVILACIRTKLEVVALDERDEGARQVLNLGHTVGHAIETATAYARYRHGEAVGLGLLAALRLSGQDELRQQVASLLERAGLPTRLEDADPAAVTDAVQRDKKRRRGEVRFVLVRAPGEIVTGQAVDPDEVASAVQELAA